MDQNAPKPQHPPAPHQRVTPELASFFGALTYDQIPDAVIRQTKKGVADNLSVILAGLSSTPATKLAAALPRMGETPAAYLIGTNEKASTRAVAMHAAA